MRGVVPTELNRLTTRSRRRGFTLVEIAIAMVVIGLLLGATAVTSRHLEEKYASREAPLRAGRGLHPRPERSTPAPAENRVQKPAPPLLLSSRNFHFAPAK